MRRRPLMLAGAALLAGCATGVAVHRDRMPADPVRVPLDPNIRADRIVVWKADRRMTLFAGGRPIATYDIALGFGEPGAKSRAGDGRTPEGLYTITGRNPDSAYHLSLRISYPEPRDIAAAEAMGVAPGGDIMIHGLGEGCGWIGTPPRPVDWTAGCISVTNEEIEEIWRAVPDGTPIMILP